MQLKIYRYIIFFATIAALNIAGTAEETRLQLETNRDELYLGESFILRVAVSGPGRNVEPNLSDIKNAKIEMLGSRDISHQSTKIVNGKMTQQSFIARVASYRLTPLTEGVMQPGKVTLAFNGQILSEAVPSVIVREIDKQEWVKLFISASRETVLVDEPFEITMTVLIKCLEGKHSAVQPLFPDNPPNIDVDYLNGHHIPGLISDDTNRMLRDRLITSRDQPGIGINNISRRMNHLDLQGFGGFQGLFSEPLRAKFDLSAQIVQQNGNDYFQYKITTTFIPHEEGDFVFGPVVFKGLIATEADERGQAKSTDIFAVGHAQTVRVTPPPEEGRPHSFVGAIGKEMYAQASIDSESCNVGDPLKLTLTLAGNIRMENMLPLKLSSQTNLTETLTIYDNTVETVKSQTARQYIYTLRPTKPGKREIPPIEVSYYNTEKRKYITVSTDPIQLDVGKAQEITASKIIGRQLQTEDTNDRIIISEQPPAPIMTTKAGSQPANLIGNTRLLALITTAGPMLYAIALTGQFMIKRKDAFRKTVRSKNAASTAIARLKHAYKEDPEHALIETRSTIRKYFENRFHISTAALTPIDVKTLLIKSGANAESAEKFQSLFETIFNAGFSNTMEHAKAKETCAALRESIANIESEISSCKGSPSSRKKTFTFIILMLLTAANTSFAAGFSERNFLWNEANARSISAIEPEDHLVAAQLYRNLINSGVHNGPLFYNLGTALLNAGDYKNAVDALLRAECYMGGRGDVKWNLKIAMARKSKADEYRTPWHRVVFFWHFKLSTPERAMLAASSFFLFWTLMILRKSGLRRWLNIPLISAILIFLLLTSSVVTSILS